MCEKKDKVENAAAEVSVMYAPELFAHPVSATTARAVVIVERRFIRVHLKLIRGANFTKSRLNRSGVAEAPTLENMA